ncbi:MAG: HlyD family efflux transporter periplasmic adaptor subunit [Roseibium sp.]|uniref:efflux RND transporter periplasmic adaptor subunit n=1 Tax=Roseibium sp. TaxID=1936156 RepID=UPI001B06AE5C|nr:HlyD family efflux transporter periplasmic adaptor subunit [Roseibium sp.]MBO6894196.1 HlyD family efflux transporter periplasmic adaptor subunit [Roseibium sp.]MBO6928892.1 HlyD family efflux transporter periplasmic adaptor subunit [Roseibium sp.]
MRFLMRGLVGLALMAVMIGFAGVGAYHLYGAMTAEETARQRPARERSYTVNVAELAPEAVTPVTVAYGQIESWRTLQLRASSEGRLVDVASKFRDGAAVNEGELLLRIDPANAEFQFLDAEAAVADAEAQKTEAQEAVVGAEQELVAARRQLELRKQALERQQQLREKGYSTEVQVETEELAVASLEQALSNRLQSVITARKRIERMDLTVQRAQLALEDAQRVLDETTLTAPFYGYLAQVDATLGRRVNPSETLALLIDPSALEVRFAVSTNEFSRLLDDSGNLIKAPVTVTLELGVRSVEVPGHIDRAAAVVSEGEAGRTLFATLDIETGTVLRPGDFVKVEVQEPELQEVALVPAGAVTEDGRLLIVNQEERIDEVRAKVLRRMGNEVVLTDVPFGTDYVRERLPQLGKGLKVSPRRSNGAEDEPDAPATARASQPEEPRQLGDLVALEPERRAALIEQLNSSNMPENRKARLLALLNKPMVPKDLVDRLEQRRGRKG